jgi:hypothetical protein
METPAPEQEIKVKTRRRRTTSEKVKAVQWTKATRPKSPGRPKGALTSPIMTVSGLMARCFRDLDFQNNFVWRSQQGKLTPKEEEMMFHFVDGRPGYKIKIEVTQDPEEAAERERLLRMDPALLARQNDLLRELEALREQRALPQARVTSSETTPEPERERIEVSGKPLSAVVDTSPDEAPSA